MSNKTDVQILYIRPVIYKNPSLLKYNFIFPNNKCTKKQLIQQINNAPHVLIFHSDNKLTNSMQLYIVIIVERICKNIVQVNWETRTRIRIHGYGKHGYGKHGYGKHGYGKHGYGKHGYGAHYTFLHAISKGANHSIGMNSRVSHLKFVCPRMSHYTRY